MLPSLIPNWILRIVKWPTALLFLCALPFAAKAIWTSSLRALTIADAQWFLIGFVGYWLSWMLLFKRRFIGSYLSTFEHELTHAIFAWLTLHKVIGLHVTWRSGGLCRFEGSGGGNWLIYIAPYWFPTVVLPCLLIATTSGHLHLQAVQILIGSTVGYQATSTWRETHLNQSDLKQTGWFFALCFLPTANLITYGSICLWILSTPSEAIQYLETVWSQTTAWISATL